MTFEPEKVPTKQLDAAFRDWSEAQLRMSAKLHDIVRATEQLQKAPGDLARERLLKLIEELDGDEQWDEVLTEAALLMTARSRLAEVEELKEEAAARLKEKDGAGARDLLEQANWLAKSYFGEGSPQAGEVGARIKDLADSRAHDQQPASSAESMQQDVKPATKEALIIKNFRESLEKFRIKEFALGLAQIRATALCAKHWLQPESELRQLITLFHDDMQRISAIRKAAGGATE